MNKIVNIVFILCSLFCKLYGKHCFSGSVCIVADWSFMLCIIIEKEETLESYAYHLGIVYILSIISVSCVVGWCKICKGFSVYVLALFCTCFLDSFTIL